MLESEAILGVATSKAVEAAVQPMAILRLKLEPLTGLIGLAIVEPRIGLSGVGPLNLAVVVRSAEQYSVRAFIILRTVLTFSGLAAFTPFSQLTAARGSCPTKSVVCSLILSGSLFACFMSPR